MRKLIAANVLRMQRNKGFWAGTVFMFATGLIYPLTRYMDMQKTGSIHALDNGIFGCTFLVGILMAVFCSLFIGTEYSDGTIRNKIVVGHNRMSIYLAHLITSALVSIFWCLMYWIPYLCVGLPLLGGFAMPAGKVLWFVLASLMVGIASASIFTCISMLITSKSTSAIVCVLLAFGLLFAGAYFNRMLSEPETTIAVVMREEGQVTEETPNPKFLQGSKREMIQGLYDAFPGGQAIQCTITEAPNIERFPLYSALILLVMTGLGVWLYQKKDLK